MKKQMNYGEYGNPGKTGKKTITAILGYAAALITNVRNAHREFGMDKRKAE